MTTILLERHNVRDIMAFKYDWSNEVIAQIYAIVWFVHAKDTDHHFAHL